MHHPLEHTDRGRGVDVVAEVPAERHGLEAVVLRIAVDGDADVGRVLLLLDGGEGGLVEGADPARGAVRLDDRAVAALTRLREPGDADERTGRRRADADVLLGKHSVSGD